MAGILLFHAGHLKGGWLGVDLFFVLSGFLITSLLLAEYRSSGRISIARFWERRARRLLPALFFFLLGVSVYAAILADASELSRIRADALSTLFYVANWNAVSDARDYWAIFQAPSPLDHTWSLAIEEQFYLVWPLLTVVVLRTFKGSVDAIALFALALAVASTLWMATLYDPEVGSARVYFGSDTRATAILAGAALAAVLGPWGLPERIERRRRAGSAAFVSCLFLAWAWSVFAGDEPIVFRGLLFANALASGTLIAVVIVSPSGLAARLLALPPMRWLGLVSYSTYLWHWPVFLVLSPERLGFEGWMLTAVQVAATIAIATFSYSFVEKPIQRADFPRHVLPLLTAAALVAVVGGILSSTHLPLQDGESSGSIALAPAGGNAETEAAQLLLVGDSVAANLGPAMIQTARERGWGAHSLGRLACASLGSEALRFRWGEVLDLSSCRALRDSYPAWVQDVEPAAVLIVEMALGERKVKGVWRKPCDEAFTTAYRQGLLDAVEAFGRRGALVAIANMPTPIPEDFAPHSRTLWGMELEGIRSVQRAEVACMNRTRVGVAADSSAVLIDLEGWVCPSGGCQRHIGSVKLRPDGVHFRGEGSRIAAGWLMEEVVSAVERNETRVPTNGEPVVNQVR